MQVVTPENLVQHITTGKVEEFKAPEPPKVEAKPDTGAKPETKPDETPRDQTTGKFVKADGEKPAAEKPDAKADGKVDAKTDADDDDAALTEKIKRIIAKKHRAMKEAEEFGTTEGRRALEAERRAEAAERELERLRGTKSDGAKPAGQVDPDEPKPEDFKTVGEYTRALTKYEVAKAREAALQNASEAKQKAAANETIQTFAQRQDAFRESTPDYDDVIEAGDQDIPNVAIQYMVESEFGPQLAYHLAKNPGEVTRLQKLSPSRCVAELGKLETRFEKAADAGASDAKAATPRAEISKAPAPIQPLKGDSTTATNKDPSQMSLPELREFRRQEALAKARR